MTSRSSASEIPFGSDNGSVPPSSSSCQPRGCDQEGTTLGTALEDRIGRRQHHVKGFALRTFCLFATLICVPAILVASWFQFRVVGGFESELTSTEAQEIAAKLDAVIDARASALRMAGGSIEIENLNASGGLNRLLSGLKGLFPDFRSFEIFSEQGQPLAMMGELSLENVGKRNGLLKLSNQDSGLPAEPMFRDVPAQDCFFLTLRHLSTDGAVWFSRARFSRESITSVLELHRSNRNARLVPVQPQGPVAEKPASGPRAVPVTSEGDNGWFNVSTRSFFAEASLATPDWRVTLERTVPLPMAYLFSLVMGGLLVAGSGALWFRSARTESSPGTLRVITHSDVEDLPLIPAEAVHAHVEEVPCQESPCAEAVGAPFEEPEATDASGAETQPVTNDPAVSEEFASALAWSPWTPEEDAFPPSALASEEELCDPFEGLEEELGLTDETVDDPYSTMLIDESEAVLVAPDQIEPEEQEFAQPSAETSVDMLGTEEEQTVTTMGDPMLHAMLPDTLEVCWDEPVEEQVAPRAEQSSVTVVNRWYSGV